MLLLKAVLSAVSVPRSVYSLSVRRSVHHTLDCYLNGSRYRNTFYIIQQSYVSIFNANFHMSEFRSLPETTVKI